jgi:hypothetical protein
VVHSLRELEAAAAAPLAGGRARALAQLRARLARAALGAAAGWPGPALWDEPLYTEGVLRLQRAMWTAAKAADGDLSREI